MNSVSRVWPWLDTISLYDITATLRGMRYLSLAHFILGEHFLFEVRGIGCDTNIYLFVIGLWTTLHSACGTKLMLCISQKTQNICIVLVQRRPKVFDFGP